MSNITGGSPAVCTPLMINQVGGKKSGGCEAQGGPSHPLDFDRGVAPSPLTPLETASAKSTVYLYQRLLNVTFMYKNNRFHKKSEVFSSKCEKIYF